jgi:hypothetical protein
MWPKAENIHRCLSKFLAKKKKDPVRWSALKLLLPFFSLLGPFFFLLLCLIKCQYKHNRIRVPFSMYS